jgi:hypothetical protein
MEVEKDINTQIRPRSRFYLASFLNLLVWPGAGTFLLNRRKEAMFQVIIALFSLALLLFGIASITMWAVPIVAHVDANNFGHDNAAILLMETYRDNPPRWLGFHSMGVLIFSLFLFVVSWVYSLISLFIYKKTTKRSV